MSVEPVVYKFDFTSITAEEFLTTVAFLTPGYQFQLFDPEDDMLSDEGEA